MVERPIKRSERQLVTESTDVVEETQSQATEASLDPERRPSKERSIPLPVRSKDRDDRDQRDPRDQRDQRDPRDQRDQRDQRSKGKGRGKPQEDERPERGNMALMRGPKPTQPKPPVVQEPEAATEELSEEAIAETEQPSEAES
jgi:hypothetical protein